MNRLCKLIAVAFVAFSASAATVIAAPSQIKTARLPAGADAADPAGAVWGKAPATEIVLVTAPAVHASISGTASVTSVAVQAFTDGKRVFFRLSWADDSADTSQEGPGRFLDGVALQFPLDKSQKTAVLMGNAGNRVNIWYWSADGKVQNLFADGLGTLTPADVQDVSGKGMYRDGRWRVVLMRPLKSAAADAIQLSMTGRVPVAPAVWNGANAERDGFKAVTMEWQSLVLTTK